MFLANDPYNGGGTHLPDINVIAPVFIGKRSPRSSPTSRITRTSAAWFPARKPRCASRSIRKACAFRRCASCEGKLNRDVFDIILLNSRTPDERVGDLQAQFAANTVGMRSVLALFERYGANDTAATIAAYLDFTEKRFRAAINQLPGGPL